jgi:hypothetical protein
MGKKKKAKPKKLKRQQILKGRRDWDLAGRIADNLMKRIAELPEKQEDEKEDE